MKNIFFVLVSLLVMAGCKKEQSKEEAVVVSGSGNITAEVDAFRHILGDVLNTTPGQSSGHREINWDGVPDIYATQKLPFDFFNPVGAGSSPSLQRGLIYDTVTDARISSNAFADFDPDNSAQFSAFSGTKTFSAVSNNLWNVDFAVPGESVAASIKGFGAVFSDVDDAESTTIEYFSGENSLGIYKVPAGPSGTHSFLGVYFPGKKVTRIRIRQGDAVVASGVKDISAGGNKDLVVMDDFLYDEPKAIQ